MEPEADPQHHGLNIFLALIGLGYIAIAIYLWRTPATPFGSGAPTND